MSREAGCPTKPELRPVAVRFYIHRTSDNSFLLETQNKYASLIDVYLSLNRLDFLQHKGAGMAEQVAWAAGHRGIEDVLLVNEDPIATSSGWFVKVRVFPPSSRFRWQAQQNETAAPYEAAALLWRASLWHCRRGPASGHPLWSSRRVGTCNTECPWPSPYIGDASQGKHGSKNWRTSCQAFSEGYGCPIRLPADSPRQIAITPAALMD